MLANLMVGRESFHLLFSGSYGGFLRSISEPVLKLNYGEQRRGPDERRGRTRFFNKYFGFRGINSSRGACRRHHIESSRYCGSNELL